MGKRTPLFDLHRASGARIVDFSGWEMPLHYGSQVTEHHQVRQNAGIFDVSHMAIIDFKGEQVRPFLRQLLANNVDRLTILGAALYGCMLNERGGVIDDLIVYFIAEQEFRIVSNAGTRDKNLAWIKSHATPFKVQIEERPDLAMIAIQGPEARAKVHEQLPADLKEKAVNLKRFHAIWKDNLFIARTGYTGEDGYELLLPGVVAQDWWQHMVNNTVAPCGLGARDTLRLEAGMSLYGTDMNEETTPLESGLGWTVALAPADRNFIGRHALETAAKHLSRQQVGLLLQGKGLLRNGQLVNTNLGEGVVTSGGFSPSLDRSIALAQVPIGASSCEVLIRDRAVPAIIVKPPFVRNGRSCLPEELIG
ncbi:glycine cleavage system aminomethyltransferase T [Candidatus Nitrosoglobus terrae]|uniref:Aminomethyltransferase n=1 Tax=Candidatus Nitrosoglobus terrae TaxID=1630141 RepID=A0A1Q2SQ17_9GAMM|nr:glycine cleavage system aminomethyltransferase GcvT [Candidatus Nitrosoglobus terrae]BAW81189.1 glycine cleavage system aminomethyltransferase T [Candidatus Nitrosoglobus terrae]